MKKAVLLLVALLAGPASAQLITGNDLLDECRRQDSYSRGRCLGLIIGVEYGFSPVNDVYGVIDPSNILSSTFGNCKPDRVTHGQLRDIVVRYLERNPAKRHESFHLLVFAAWQEAYPCQPRRR